MRRLNDWKFPVLVLMLAGLILVACGKKGPLYLPDKPRPSSQQTHPN